MSTVRSSYLLACGPSTRIYEVRLLVSQIETAVNILLQGLDPRMHFSIGGIPNAGRIREFHIAMSKTEEGSVEV